MSLPAAPASRLKFVVKAVYRRQVRFLEPLVGVEAGQRHFRRAGQVQVVVLEMVKVRRLGGQEAGAVHGPFVRQDRRQDEQETTAGELVDDVAVKRHLRHRHVANAVRKPGAG